MPSGPYDLDVALGNLQDLCGNTVQVGDKLSFDHLGTVGITASSTDICNAGDAVTLTATGGGAGATYVWTPGISGSSLSEVVNPLVSTNYSLSVTYGGCTKATTQSIEVVDNVITTIDPVDPQICSGTTSLTASTTINGNPCVGCTYVWDDGLSQTTPTANTLSPGTYSVVVATSGGCSGDNLPASTISLASGGGGTSCDILYVASGASGGGLTKDDPMDFEAALAAALCSNTIIKCQVGDYSYDKFIQINSYVTIEGGYNSGFTQKISSWNTGSCTRFIRDNATADGGSGNDYTMFKTVNSSQGWRIQDVKIVMPNHTLGSGYQNFGIQLGGANTGYKIVRCIIDGGTAG